MCSRLSEHVNMVRDWERPNGLTIAERNAQINPQGCHTFGGLLIGQILPGLLVGGAEKLAGGLNGSGDTGSETNVEEGIKNNRNLSYIQKSFSAALNEGKYTEAERYLKELKSMSESDSKYTKYYNEAKKSYDNRSKV